MAHQPLKDPISKLSHHERTVNSATSNECQKALLNYLKVRTHYKNKTTTGKKLPFDILNSAEIDPEKPIGSRKIPYICLFLVEK